MKKLGIRISGPSLSSALEASIKQLILLIRIIIIFGPLQALVMSWSYLGVGGYLQNLKVILEIWQTLKRIIHDKNQF